MNIPRHVAIIMDGNGRWAQARGLPRAAGHKAGVDAVRRTLEAAKELGVRVVTLYAFSAENWQRPAEEVEGLMGLLRFYLKSELSRLHKEGVKVRVIGDVTALASDIQAMVRQAQDVTADNTVFTLCIGLNYGGRQELTHAMRAMAEQVMAGTLLPQDIKADLIETQLYTHGVQDPDLIIRTSGEQRISNFLLWQGAYSEFYTTPVYWPDFDKNELTKALDDYARRDRRFGAIAADNSVAQQG